MKKEKVDTRAIGLDIAIEFTNWLTGADNLHYGLWDDLEVTAANLGRAQAAYTEKLLGYLPGTPLSVLDIGGGGGETAKKLIALGHRVEIVVPSRVLAARCATNAPEAVLHETTFEAFSTDLRFDICLFSESFQYIPMETALSKARDLLAPGGRVLIADCFRSESFEPEGAIRVVGGGHPIADFHAAIPRLGLTLLHSEDITDATAPSIDLERGYFLVAGRAVERIDAELRAKRPIMRWLLVNFLKLLLGQRKLVRVNARLNGLGRTSEVFRQNNRYLIALLARE